MSNVVTLEQILPTGPPPTDPVAHAAVLVSLNFPDMDDDIADLVRRFTKVALQTLQDEGATFEVVDTSTPTPGVTTLEGFDGLLLLGGGDIDSQCYSTEPIEVPNSYGIDARADRDAFEVIERAEEAELPVLGICRGAQLINVHRGGTIIPDIDDYELHHGGPGEPVFLDEKISLVPGTRLAGIFGTDTVVGRSGHHQAVSTVGEGLVASARALDGIVEAIEDPDRWIVGVQWHPEDDDGPSDDRHSLFGAFVRACQERRGHAGKRSTNNEGSAEHD